MRCGMPGAQRQPVVDAVMEELQGLLDAVGAFETAVATYFGLGRDDLRWFSVLAGADAAMPFAELANAAAVPADRLRDGLDRLARAGHLEAGAGAADRIALTPAARGIVFETYARVEHAYVGLHRYGAEELSVVRRFLRLGRHYYEGQTLRFERRVGRETGPG
jgi:hypothetical protein